MHSTMYILPDMEKGADTQTSEMEYCASATSMITEEIWQIAEGFVEVLANL